jgi:hypothetical protein
MTKGSKMKKQQRTETSTAGKLKLSGETIRILEESDLREAVGGETPGTSVSGLCLPHAVGDHGTC